MNPFKLIASIYAHPFCVCYSQHEDVVIAYTKTFIMFFMIIMYRKK